VAIHGTQVPTSVYATLSRSGIVRAIKQRQEREAHRSSLDGGAWAAQVRPSHVVEMNTRDELLIADIHASVDAVFSRQVSERSVPTWLSTSFPNASPTFYPHAEKIIGELVKNVREHAGLLRGPDAEATLHLTATRGGGSESTDRLWIVVSDNGMGMRASLEARRGGAIDSAVEEILYELLMPESRTANPETIRDLTGAGDGLADLHALCLQLDQVTGHQSEIYYYSTSTVDSTHEVETLIAQVRPTERKNAISSTRAANGATGTLAMVLLPAGTVRGVDIAADSPGSGAQQELSLFGAGESQ